ncbi:MAG: hypothetical protein ACI4U3_01555 [Traorella sp.]
MKIYEVNGNRFILGHEDVDVEKLCNEYDCDGYLKIISHQIQILNKDGSSASLCVNGLHCFTQYLYDYDYKYKVYALITGNEVYKSEIMFADPFVSKISIKTPKVFRNFVSVGNEHMILIDEDSQDASILCNRYDCNINYVTIINRKCIKVKTYERGVGFTKSCGSGNVASAVYCYLNDLCDEQVDVINDGGLCSIELNDDIEITSMSRFVQEI